MIQTSFYLLHRTTYFEKFYYYYIKKYNLLVPILNVCLEKPEHIFGWP